MQAKPYRLITPISFRPRNPLQPPCNVRFQPNIITHRKLSNSTSATLSSSLEVDEEVAFWDYQFLFMSQRLEVPSPIKLNIVDGAIPKDFPSGTYYLTGPGLFIDDYGSTINPLDGHGYVRAFEIDGPNGEVRFSARYVKTEAQMEECDPVNGSWRFTHRGPFSVLKGGKMIANTKVMKNVANTSILRWGGRLFCLWEGGLPYEIDPLTLDTIGKFNLINDNKSGNEVISIEASMNQWHPWGVLAHVLKPILSGLFKMPPKRLLSHYKIDAQRKRLIILTCNAEDMLLPMSHFTFYEFDFNFKLLNAREFEIPHHLFIHDWAFTSTHYVLLGNRIKLDGIGSVAAIFGIAPMISALSINHNEPTSPIYILPRFFNHCETWKQPIEAPQLWLLHIANAFEDRDDDGNLSIQIHASACAYEWFNFENMFGYNWQSGVLEPSGMNRTNQKQQLLPHLVEVTVKLERENNHRVCFVSRLDNWCRPSDFPTINSQCSGYKHKYVYAAASSGDHQTLPHFPFDTVVKVDTLNNNVHTWSAGGRRFVGEPMFVSKESFLEDDGYLLVVEYVVSHRMCYLLILDPKLFGERGALIARIEVPKSLAFPLGFHGTWASKV